LGSGIRLPRGSATGTGHKRGNGRATPVPSEQFVALGSMDPEIPRRGDNGLRTGPLILHQLRQNFETFFSHCPLMVIVLVELQTIGHGRINSGTNPMLSGPHPVFKENPSNATQDPPSNLSGF
jgi:hypothetical protein